MKKSPLNAPAFSAAGTNLGLASAEAHRLQQTLGEALGAASARLAALSQWRVLPPARRGELLLRQQCLARWRHLAAQTQDFKAMLGLSVGPGFKALRGRHAFLEIGSSSYGGEVFMGIDKRSSTGLSVGVFGGIALGVGESSFHASIGGGFGYGYSHDRSGPSDVIIRTRVERDEANKPTDSWRRKANDVLGFLFAQSERAEGARGAAPEALWQDFSQRFFRERDVSVNWRDQRRSSHTVSKIANVMARFSLAGWTSSSRR